MIFAGVSMFSFE